MDDIFDFRFAFEQKVKEEVIDVFSDWKTRARVTPRADKALTPDIFYD